MTMSLSQTGQSVTVGRLTFPLLSVASALIVFAVLQALVLRITGGVFEYPLDDPYIHLALAETIARGGYGVNLGDVSSPGSSALFPLLLVPFSGTELHRYLPLLWNVVGMGATAWLWGRLLAEAGYRQAGWHWLGLAAALLGPIAVMIPMVGYVGMEHTLHAAAAMAVILGLYRHFDGRSGLVLICAGAFLGTALRIEGAALALLAAGALFFTGERRAGVTVAALGLLPLVLFAGLLVSLGLDPLPSSVQSKLAHGTSDAPGFLARRLSVVANNLVPAAGKFVLILAIAALIVWRAAPTIRSGRWSAFAAVVVLAAAAHLAAGQIGWLNRYEHYILVATAAGLLAMLPKAFGAPGPGWIATGAVALVVLGGFITYRIPLLFHLLPPAARAIHLQQGQMSTFVKDHWQGPVAVNDLGLVSWQNDAYVLDLWGLASSEAREIRLTNATPGWAGDLTDKYDVPVAMVYDHWFGDGLGDDWVKLGSLDLTVPGGFLGGHKVAFYATDPAAVDDLRSAVAGWTPTLLPGTEFNWAEGMAP
ncbi:hypothetical protein [Maritimibacter sp. UBA3975]|uniref:hypothetical protein n=1 Tax=Maritimibacter sp. UBA3975 TaxID=1946833 RepID=UPI000C0B86A1|nr:hypothetical protein [Maritimibacter sp. UBA3975]MAM62708.1 hypothetical protein [Maritimibacter sp.]|tara:strand:- start:8669 stop:10273 length:1605 start_codon:yes stop_codon:yes gene_type:complete